MEAQEGERFCRRTQSWLVTDTARMQPFATLKPDPGFFQHLVCGRVWGGFIARERPPPAPRACGRPREPKKLSVTWAAFSAPETRKPGPLGPAATHTELFLPSTSVTSLHLPALERPSGQSGCSRKSLDPEANVYALLSPAAVSRGTFGFLACHGCPGSVRCLPRLDSGVNKTSLISITY